MSEPQIKKQKMEFDNGGVKFIPTCKHFVTRKKRFCKMTVTKMSEYCAEHIVKDDKHSNMSSHANRIPCPFDPKHSVYANKLTKHLKHCNAKPKELPPWQISGLNMGSDDDDESESNRNFKLSEIEEDLLTDVIKKVENLYEIFVEGSIEELNDLKDHEILKKELDKPDYGTLKLKHLKQTSCILGSLEHLEFLKSNTCFIEFGAGKGQVSYFLAQAIEKLENSFVILIDKASHRHKQDNKIPAKDSVCRIRADIGDLNIKQLNMLKDAKKIIGISKHLCGAATDLALRCIITGNKKEEGITNIPTKGLFIALCCHHRCEWKSFVGKNFFKENGINNKNFALITKMVGWAICSTGLSRERRKEIEEKGTVSEEAELDPKITALPKLSRLEKEAIGFKCKRIIDYARKKYLEDNGFECNLNYYVKSEITLENVCLVGKLKNVE